MQFLSLFLLEVQVEERVLPQVLATSSSSSSMRSSWLYLATRSVRLGAPVLIWPAFRATARSAMVVSSVSPERWETTAVYPAPVGHLDGVQGLGEGADLVDFDEDGVGHPFLDAGLQALGVGDEQSSPTSWRRLPRVLVSRAQPSQSFSPMPSSRERMG